SENSRHELEAANAQLREQTIELDLANQQLQESAVELEATTSELEASSEELENTLAALEERTEAAETAERTLTNVFSQAPAAVSVTSGPEHRFVLINARAKEIIGRTDLVGKSFVEAFPEFAEQGFASILDNVYSSGERHVAHEAPVLITRPDGSTDERWFDFVYEPLRDAAGSVTGVLQHSVDVTPRVLAQRALVESERQFRTLADAIPTLAWTADAQGFIDWYNARWYEYTGATSEAMEGWGWQSVHDPDVLPTVMERWQASIASGEQFEMTFPLRAADGTYRSFLTRVSPVKDDNGQVLRWFGTNTDVTLEESARREAEEANAAKSQFLANMSHELRQPLNAITGYADLITLGVRGPVTDQQREDLERIRASSTHLTSLISDILQFAKLEAGRLEYHMSEVPVGETLRETATFVAPQVREKNLTFTVEPVGDDVTVHADRERFVQVVLNLLTNATKFTGEGGSITVSASCSAPEGMIAICVADTGIGIAPDKLQRIFDPFVQVNRSLNRPSEGTGLGLAIARDIARNMKGDLTVESEEGVGSTFVVTLPAGAPRGAAV
ncbi:MAG: PAS domain-containing sensor histidine kinase, partial [Gemmatimonadota bacterium]|nr:PAS domain-containing sensor histidine kinase [Gemmatimonadota bacterium]